MPLLFTTGRRLTISLSLAVLGLIGATSTRADTPPLCKEIDYKVVTPNLVAVRCEQPDVSSLIASGQLYESSVGLNSPPTADIDVTPYPGAREWLILDLKPHDPAAKTFSLQQGKTYKIVFSLHAPGEPVPSAATPTSFDLDVNNTVTMNPSLAMSSNRQFEFVSHLAYQTGPEGECTLQVEDFSAKLHTLTAHDCTVPAPIDPTKVILSADLVRAATSPEDLGSFQLTLNGAKDTQQLPTSVSGLSDIFGKAIKIDAKSQIVPEKAPASKDSSNYYANLNYAAGRGSTPGWVLDAKIAPTLGKLFYGYQFSPSVTADVGENKVSNLTYTDTIDAAASLAHMYPSSGVLQGLLFMPGLTYETDREFDRHNLLATPGVQFRFANLYNPRERRSAIKFRSELQIADAKNIPWTRANSKQVLFGYLLNFGAGLELGGALTDTTVKASVGNATLPLPSYSIARVVPQAHGLLEIGRLSFDGLATVRYLTIVENTVLERPNHTLFLERVHGWNAYGVCTASWSFDPAGHFALTVAYKDGFSPPKFSRVNTVQSGITIKY